MDLVVVGGGIIGLAVAWRAAQRGMRVRVLERGSIGSGASAVAAGMLAPVSEIELGEHGRRMLAISMRAVELWHDFAPELEAAAGCAVAMRHTGLLMVARDDDEARELERQMAFRESLGMAVQRLLPAQARELEPALAPTVRMALLASDDHSVEPRAAVAALRRACEAIAVDIRERAPVAEALLSEHGDRLYGVRTQDGAEHRADQVVLATGAWSGSLRWLPAEALLPVRPVKGQVLRLRDPAGSGLAERPLRCPDCYIVPRADGSYVLGATMEERGFDDSANAGATYELLRAGQELLPGITELVLEEIAVGFRPGSPDNTPLLGPGALAGLYWATGHFRNGILLAPFTGELIASLLSGAAVDPEHLKLCSPARMQGLQAVAAADAGVAGGSTATAEEIGG